MTGALSATSRSSTGFDANSQLFRLVTLQGLAENGGLPTTNRNRMRLSMNELRRFLAVSLACGLAAFATPLAAQAWKEMDYGPYFTASVEVAKGNIAYKGVTIRLDGGTGGVAAGKDFVIFDTDTLRYAGAWSGAGCIDWRNIAMDGSHGTHPKLVGERLFTNGVAPGWGSPADASFEDPRLRGLDKKPYGPLPRDWAHWKGLYLHGDQVVLSYTVGDTGVLERPTLVAAGDARLWTRTLQLGPRSKELVLQVAERPGESLRLDGDGEGQVALFGKAETASQAPSNDERLVFDGGTALDIKTPDTFEFRKKDFSIYARLRTKKGGTILAKTPKNNKWAENGATFFVRGGRLCYDIGWVGVVESDRKVADGKWHDVVVCYDQVEGLVRLYVDGEVSGQREMQPKGDASDFAVRIGYTASNFPDKSGFEGELSDVRFYQRLVDPSEIARKVETESLVARWQPSEARGDLAKDVAGGGHDGSRLRLTAVAGGGGGSWLGDQLVIGRRGGPAECRWERYGDGGLRLRIPAGPPTRLTIAMTSADAASGRERFASLPAAEDLVPLTRGGPARWGETLRTQASILGDDKGPFVVETITTPQENPYKAWIRLGGFDFFKDGKRAAVCTWNGDVWTVDGVGGDLKEFAWRRIASGMFQPLGLKIVDEVIYVLGRDQITRLHDLNGDGQVDFYENFNNDAQATEHFHEFAMDLQADADGNFYYAKGGRHAKDCVVPQHGSILKVDKDGQRTERVAYGFRAPNGLCVNPDGSFLTSDQEGHWTPANRINWVKQGGFYGYMWSYHLGEPPKTYDKPLCWLHPKVDRSPASQLWVDSDSWGALNGKLLAMSYGTGLVYHLLHEEVAGQKQGGIVKMPIPMFPTGTSRGRFHSGDGQLYICGLFGWSSNRTRPGGFYRIRRTDKPLHLPLALHATKDGLLLRFAEPLDARRAGRPGAYRIERWNYLWQQRYGSKDYKLSDGKIGRDTVEVKAVRLSKDGRSVFLEIEDMQPCMQMLTTYRLAAEDGTRLAQEIYHTIHNLGESAPLLEEF